MSAEELARIVEIHAAASRAIRERFDQVDRETTARARAMFDEVKHQLRQNQEPERAEEDRESPEQLRTENNAMAEQFADHHWAGRTVTPTDWRGEDDDYPEQTSWLV